MRRRGAHGAQGFTLMETLVMLTLTALATALMFQMLAAYGVARSRTIAQVAGIDRHALFMAWWRESVRGAVAMGDGPLSGSERRVEFETLLPLLAPPGAPSPVAWELVSDAGAAWTIVYFEHGEEKFRVPLSGVEAARFAYLDPERRIHDRWPPALGEQAPLPALVALSVQRTDDNEQVVLAAVYGPLEPVVLPFEAGGY